MQHPRADPDGALILRRAIVALVGLALAGGAHAQQAELPLAVLQQPFGQPPPPPPPPPRWDQPAQPPQDEERIPRAWFFRGMVASAEGVDMPVEIDQPVTGYGNEALWDVPRLAPDPAAKPVKVAEAPSQR